MVLDKQISLGALLAITYITAQTDYPLTLFLDIFRSFQDANLSLMRLNEVSRIKEEDCMINNTNDIYNLRGDIVLRNLSFRYDITSENNILQSLNVTIKKGEITAIVGCSGSGKTTLLRLLLGLYNPDEGEVLINNINLKHILKDKWRKLCAAVMQDGYCFSDTIANNVVLSPELQDEEKIIDALKAAAIYDFVITLPLGIHTRIGEDGIKMSKGQMQRILLARAVYRNPNFLFLDEPTNSLDAVSENKIMCALKKIYVGKTVLIIAHRFSTIKNANKIIVLKKGQIIEVGTHEQLFQKKGYYYTLFINQKLFNNET